MNYTYHERARIDRTPVRKLSDAEVQAVRDQLAADYRAQMARLRELARIIADREARRAGIDYDCPWQVYEPTPLAIVPRGVMEVAA